MKKKLCEGTLDKCARILSDNEERIVYQVKNGDGELVITEYPVFPGIWLMYKEAHAQKYKYPPDYPSGLLEITHCREGRFEYDAGERFFYLSEGDMSVGKSMENASVYCPTQHYHGVSVIIDPSAAPNCLSCLLEGVKVSPSELLDKFCGKDEYFIMRSTSQIEHIFSELYSVPDRIRKGYFKIKILELLLFLSDLDPKLSQTEQRSCSRAQAELAKQVCRYVSSHLDVRLTIDQLAAKFYVSSGVLKKCFYSVYGESVYAYIKAYKMQAAAFRLKSTDQTVSEIAHDFGYENNSKFTTAFRNVMGESPTQYRKNNRERNT